MAILGLAQRQEVHLICALGRFCPIAAPRASEAHPETDFEIIVGYRRSESHCMFPYDYCTCLARLTPIGEAVLEKLMMCYIEF